MPKPPDFFYSQRSTLPREPLAKFYLSMTFDLTPFRLGFCQPKKTWGGGGNGPLPNVAISSQMMMKLGKGILWVEIFRN